MRYVSGMGDFYEVPGKRGGYVHFAKHKTRFHQSNCESGRGAELTRDFSRVGMSATSHTCSRFNGFGVVENLVNG